MAGTTSSTHLYVHAVWATRGRAPLIQPALEDRLFGCLRDKCHELNCQWLAIGGTVDHVHILARLHATVAVAELVKAMKGSSSHFLAHEVLTAFRWQAGYGAFTVSLNHVPVVRRYVEQQKEHHLKGKLWDAWEQCASMTD